jgi:hypothetical protein
MVKQAVLGEAARRFWEGYGSERAAPDDQQEYERAVEEGICAVFDYAGDLIADDRGYPIALPWEV